MAQDLNTEPLQFRLPQLDALRGLAALYVVIYHVMAMADPDLAVPAALLPFVGMGGTGVALFFVMSAFSLCLTWPRHAASGAALRSFYLSRWFRIAPLLLVLLAVMLLKDQLREPARYGVAETVWNVSMLFGLSPDWQPGIVMGSWTIGVEVLFYLLFPLFAIWVRGLLGQVLLLALAFALSLWAAGLPAPFAHLGGVYGALTHWPVFAWGCVLFQLWLSLRDRPQRILRPLGIALLLMGVVGNALLFYRLLPPVPGLNDWYQCALFYGAMLLGLLLANNRLLVNRATCFLGTISYSLYLVHPFVVSRLYGVFARLYEHLPPGAAYAGCAAISLALAIPAAWLTYRFVEKPGIRLGHRLFACLSARKRAPAGETQGAY
ncbi:acyltransferase family protein [Lysobacter antibioticus]|uniref:acyltransferase family protein n=1 Tax=Lysobacter antibioticus TaxID=84531 RepID=UPI0007171C8A|nr:acyltransferase [Lysobacter antibioticus]ALN65625.1 acyltransferase family protein [Lysobacter antibioticus]